MLYPSKAVPLLFATFLSIVFQSATMASQISVTTWHYNNARTSANTQETILTPANVNVQHFMKLFTQVVDGQVVGHALYLPNVTISVKGTHNVVYVATMHDSVYAFDADSNTGPNATPLWQTSLLVSGATSVPISVQGCGGVTAWTEVGVVSTPVIDSSTGTLYVVAKTEEGGILVNRLHALDVATGNEKFGPVKINATFVQGGKTYTFSNTHEVNRPGLLLVNGNVYIAFGSNGCDSGDQGWIIAYNASTLQQVGAFDDMPGKSFAAIWQKGGGISADTSGNIYAETGDGQVVPGVDFGESVLELNQVGNTLSLFDWFTPYNWSTLTAHDKDFDQSVVILPNQSGTYPHLAIATNKTGTLYLLDRDNMGHLCSTCTTGDTQIVQEVPNLFGPETGTPVFWNQTVYSTGQAVPIKAFKMTNGLISTTPAAQSIKVAGGGHAIISANGNTNGILWVINGGQLFAFNAANLTMLYNSAQAANGRDKLPALAHFATPIEVNGKVYVGTKNSLVVYGP